MFRTILAAGTLTLLAAHAPARAQQPVYLAANCANCHGTDGRSAGGIPPLAGLEPALFIERMNTFKSGTRAATVMHQIAKGYTDEQVRLIAGHFAAQQPSK